MPKINLLNHSLIVSVADPGPIIDLDMEVFYIVWKRNGEKFYMADISDDGTQMTWTRIVEDGQQFLGEDEAKIYMRKAINAGRRGLDIITKEIQMELDMGY